MSETSSRDLESGAVGQRQQVIASSIRWTAPLVVLGVPLLHLFVVPSPQVEGMAERLALAVHCALIAAVPYFAVCMTILSTRFRSGSHDPISHAETPAMKIDCRVLQNHLEQLVLFTLVMLALATTLPRDHLQILPIATAVVFVARFIYWRGYHRNGTLGRAPGVQLTMFVTAPLMVLAVVLVVLSAFATLVAW